MERIGRQTHPFERIKQVPPYQLGPIWTDIQTQLIRLEAKKTAGKTLSPLQKIKVIQQLVGPPHQSIRGTARLFSVDPWAVTVARRDVRAAFSFVQRDILDHYDQSMLEPDEQLIVDRLNKLDERARRVARIVTDDRVIKVLEPLPHLLALLKTYSEYLTVTPLLEDVDIRPSRGHQMNYYDSFVDNLLFNKKTKGLRRIARRYLFALWLKTGKNWYGINIDNYILNTVVSLFSTHEPNNDFILKLRQFFKEILSLELKQARKQFPDEPDALATMFPTYDGKPPQSIEDVNLEKSWNYFASTEYLPKCLLEIIKRLVRGETGYKIAETMEIGNGYSKKTIGHWLSAATTFLENILLLKNCRNGQKLSQVTQRIDQQYQIARAVIQAVANQTY